MLIVIATGPNPWKVAIILEELNIPYTTKFMGRYSIFGYASLNSQLRRYGRLEEGPIRENLRQW